MTPFLWLLAWFGLTACAACAGAIIWSIWVLVTGKGTTTSMFMATLPRLWVFVFGLAAGTAIGFVAGHWWWPIHLP